MSTRRTFLQAGLIGGTATLFGIRTAWCQDQYPTKLIQVVLGSQAGAMADVVCRLIAAKLSESWGQPVIAVNRPGASGIIATELVAKAPADGYTLTLGYTGTHAANSSLYKTLPYDPVRDFAPISLVVSAPVMLVINPAIPADSVAALLQVARERPGSLSFASSGIGTASHLAGLLFILRTGVKLLHVPYKSSSAVFPDLVKGDVSMTFDNPGAALPHVKTGKLRALAVTSLRRMKLAPEIPTMIEAGVADFQIMNWYGFYAPAATPTPIIAKLHAEIERIKQMPEVQARLTSLGMEIRPSDPNEFAAFMTEEMKRYALLVKATGVSLD